MVRYTGHVLQSSRGSFRNMILTHPPIREVRLRQHSYEQGFHWSDDEVAEPECCNAVLFGAFIRSAAIITGDQIWGYSHSWLIDPGYKMKVEVVGGELWRLCPKSADEMTGWEMLTMLDEDIEDADPAKVD